MALKPTAFGPLTDEQRRASLKVGAVPTPASALSQLAEGLPGEEDTGQAAPNQMNLARAQAAGRGVGSSADISGGAVQTGAADTAVSPIETLPGFQATTDTGEESTAGAGAEQTPPEPAGPTGFSPSSLRVLAGDIGFEQDTRSGIEKAIGSGLGAAKGILNVASLADTITGGGEADVIGQVGGPVRALKGAYDLYRGIRSGDPVETGLGAYGTASGALKTLAGVAPSAAAAAWPAGTGIMSAAPFSSFLSETGAVLPGVTFEALPAATTGLSTALGALGAFALPVAVGGSIWANTKAKEQEQAVSQQRETGEILGSAQQGLPIVLRGLTLPDRYAQAIAGGGDQKTLMDLRDQALQILQTDISRFMSNTGRQTGLFKFPGVDISALEKADAEGLSVTGRATMNAMMVYMRAADDLAKMGIESQPLDPTSTLRALGGYGGVSAENTLGSTGRQWEPEFNQWTDTAPTTADAGISAQFQPGSYEEALNRYFSQANPGYATSGLGKAWGALPQLATHGDTAANVAAVQRLLAARHQSELEAMMNAPDTSTAANSSTWMM